jgi:hypothetical protein
MRRAALQNKIHRLAQGMDQFVQLSRPVLLIAVVHEDGATAGAAAGVHVAPAVADEIARGEVDPMPGGGREDHPGFGSRQSPREHEEARLLADDRDVSLAG